MVLTKFLLKPFFHPNNSDGTYPYEPAKTNIASNSVPILLLQKLFTISLVLRKSKLMVPLLVQLILQFVFHISH